jgi:hypothetical protein
VREERSKFVEDSGSRASTLMVRQFVERDMVNCFWWCNGQDTDFDGGVDGKCVRNYRLGGGDLEGAREPPCGSLVGRGYWRVG